MILREGPLVHRQQKPLELPAAFGRVGFLFLLRLSPVITGTDAFDAAGGEGGRVGGGGGGTGGSKIGKEGLPAFEG